MVTISIRLHARGQNPLDDVLDAALDKLRLERLQLIKAHNERADKLGLLKKPVPISVRFATRKAQAYLCSFWMPSFDYETIERRVRQMNADRPEGIHPTWATLYSLPYRRRVTND